MAILNKLKPQRKNQVFIFFIPSVKIQQISIENNLFARQTKNDK